MAATQQKRNCVCYSWVYSWRFNILTFNTGGSMNFIKKLWIKFKVHLLKSYFEMSGTLKKKKDD